MKEKYWIIPVDSSFSQMNFMGMNNSDCGGGIPLVDLWRKDAGIATGHAGLIPGMVSLPVEKDKYDSFAAIGIEYEYPVAGAFRTGDTIKTFSTFVTVHSGECFTFLKRYSGFMQASGIKLAPVAPDAVLQICPCGIAKSFFIMPGMNQAVASD